MDVVFPPKAPCVSPRSLKRARADDPPAGVRKGGAGVVPALPFPVPTSGCGGAGSPTTVAADALTALYLTAASGNLAPPPWSASVMLPFMGMTGLDVRAADVERAATYVADNKVLAEAHAAALRRDAEELQHIEAGSDDVASSPAGDSSYDEEEDVVWARGRRRAGRRPRQPHRRAGVSFGPGTRLVFGEGDGLGPVPTNKSRSRVRVAGGGGGSGGGSGGSGGGGSGGGAGTGRSPSRSASRSPSRSRSRSLSANGARDFVPGEMSALAVLTSRMTPEDAAAGTKVLQSGVALNAAGIVAADASLAAAAVGHDGPGAGGPCPLTWETARVMKDVAVLFADLVALGREDEAMSRLESVSKPVLAWNCDLLRALVAARKFRAASLVLTRVFEENSQAWPFEGSDSGRVAASLGPEDTRQEAAAWWRTLRDAYLGVPEAVRAVLPPCKVKGLGSVEGLRVQPRVGLQPVAVRTINHALRKFGLHGATAS
jgi:hypothetical protein